MRNATTAPLYDTDTEDMSYQGLPDAEDIDIERRVWTPTKLQLARYRRIEDRHAASNLRKLMLSSQARSMLTITNGLMPGRGYASIGVIVGGPDQGECLHSLSTFGRAMRDLRAGPRCVIDLADAAE